MTTTTLRPLRSADAPDVLAAFQSAADMARQGDVETLDDAGAYVRRLVAPDGPHRAWAVTESDIVVGLVAVSVDARNLSGWFWYWLHAAHRGRGRASRAAATVANWSLSDAGLHRLELGHRVDNPASGTVARAAGFVREGLEREKFLIDDDRVDVLTYGRLRSDPRPATATLPMA
ncbi:GNAT family protein [Georgenia sp. MJ173]|uniref:GNAT family N-acetyltransferase n=1 Tax=Georgenia sunbinii TaxID=3117728 RepID=UPI002F266363